MKMLILPGLLLAACALADPIPFETFIKLHTGMREAEVIELAGAPDYVSAGALVKSVGGGRVVERDTRFFTWFSGGTNPYTTTLTLRAGIVVDIQRDKKL